MQSTYLLFFLLSLVTFASTLAIGTTDAGTAASILHVTLGGLAFLFDGGYRVTVRGIFSLASAGFLGVPYVYGWLGVYPLEQQHHSAALLAFFALSTTLLVSSIRTSNNRRVRQPKYIHQLVDGSANPSTFLWLAIVMSLLSLILIGLGRLPRFFVDPALFMSIGASSCLAILSIRNNKRMLRIAAIGLIAVGVALYISMLFYGLGRIRLVSIYFFIIFIFSFYNPRRMFKLLTLCIAPVFMIWAGFYRGGAEEFDASIIMQAKGLHSVLAPFLTFADLLYAYDRLVDLGVTHYYMGETYLYGISYYWIPRALWPDKPLALGAMYAIWFTPELVEKGHTIAGSYLGEIFVNFGLSGLVLLPFLLGLLLRRIEQRLHQISVSTNDSIHSMFLVIACAVIGASVLDFVWADSNTFVQRGGLRLAVCLLCWFVIANALPRKRARNAPHRHTRTRPVRARVHQWSNFQR